MTIEFYLAEYHNASIEEKEILKEEKVLYELEKYNEILVEC